MQIIAPNQHARPPLFIPTPHAVASAIPAFLRRYPELSVDIALSPAHVSLLDEWLDLAIRIGVLGGTPLVVHKLALSRLVARATPAYLDEHGVPREPSDLAKHNCLCNSLLPWGDEWRLAVKHARREQHTDS